MKIDKSNEIKEAMANIYTQIAEREDKSTQISNITYYKELAFDSARFIENDVFVTKLNSCKVLAVRLSEPESDRLPMLMP